MGAAAGWGARGQAAPLSTYRVTFAGGCSAMPGDDWCPHGSVFRIQDGRRSFQPLIHNVVLLDEALRLMTHAPLNAPASRPSPFAHGEHRNENASVFTKGPRKGPLCVWNDFKNGDAFADSFITREFRTVNARGSQN